MIKIGVIGPDSATRMRFAKEVAEKTNLTYVPSNIKEVIEEVMPDGEVTPAKLVELAFTMSHKWKETIAGLGGVTGYIFDTTPVQYATEIVCAIGANGGMKPTDDFNLGELVRLCMSQMERDCDGFIILVPTTESCISCDYNYLSYLVVTGLLTTSDLNVWAVDLEESDGMGTVQSAINELFVQLYSSAAIAI